MAEKTDYVKKDKPLLKVDDLKVSFFTPAGEVKAVNGISYELHENEIMGIVGESGSGKSEAGIYHWKSVGGSSTAP